MFCKLTNLWKLLLDVYSCYRLLLRTYKSYILLYLTYPVTFLYRILHLQGVSSEAKGSNLLLF